MDLPQVGVELVKMTPSNQPALGLTAHTPATDTPSHAAGLSQIRRVGSMQSVIDDLAQLATTISQDRDLHVYSKDVLLDAHVVGDGFIYNPEASDEAEMDEGRNTGPQPPLLVSDGNSGDNLMNGDSEYIDEGVQEEDDRELADAEETHCDEVIKWLNSLGDQIMSLHQTPTAGKPTPCPHLAIEPKAYQYTALAKIEHNRESPLKAILLGDPPGLGKTLPAMMAVVKAIPNAKRFSIVVVPSSCAEQWKTEFAKFFLPDTVRVFPLHDPNTSPLELLKHDVILVSYAFVMSQYRKLCKYSDGIANFKKNGTGGRLERPSLSIFSEIFNAQEGAKCPYIVLDEVTAIKNSAAITFAAIEELRSLADTCIMLTGSPLDNTWMDLYAYLQLVSGHSILSKPTMISLFASRSATGKVRPPRGNKFRRMLQLLNSFVVRRPEDIIELPALHERTVKFSLDRQDAEDSDYHFQKYSVVANMNAKDALSFARKGHLQPWKHLTRAMQYAMHPALVLIMHLVHNPLAKDNDQASADVLYEAKDIEKWTAWRDQLKQGDNWKSSRITVLLDIFNECRDVDPACSVLIFDESVYFLDIVQVAFEKMYDPVSCLRFDGREPPGKRPAILQDFEKAAGPKALLISRATGGVGLNITSANVVILCGPWWKSEWERQAIKRAHRPGQTREVFAIKIQADNCALEAYKANLRDKKDKHNSQLVLHITRKDGDLPKVWDNLE